jgi:hypothetical protein
MKLLNYFFRYYKYENNKIIDLLAKIENYNWHDRNLQLKK